MMRLRYTVTENNYIELLEAQLKRQDMRPRSILIMLICTCQLGVYIALVAARFITGVHVYVLGAMSILIFGLLIMIRLNIRRRAVAALKRLQRSGNLNPDFWKEHHFIFEDNLTIRYGSLKSTYSLVDINGYDELESSFIVYAAGTIADIVPYSAIADKDDFIKKLISAPQDKIRNIAEKNRESIPESYKYAFEYTYSMDGYIAQQRDAYRKMYTTKLMWKPLTIARLFISFYALIYMFYNPTGFIITLCMLFFLVLNLQHIVTFTPLSNLTIKQGLQNALGYKPDSPTNVYVTFDTIILRSDMNSLDIPIRDFKAMRRIHGGIALYLPGNAILTIPASSTKQTEEFEKFTKFLDYKIN